MNAFIGILAAVAVIYLVLFLANSVLNQNK